MIVEGAIIAGAAAATLVTSLAAGKALSVKVEPFTALVVERSFGLEPKAHMKGTALVFPRSATQVVALTPRTLEWGTPEGGELVIADGSRLALMLRLWFQVRASAQHVVLAWQTLGARLDPGAAAELHAYLAAQVATAAAEVTRSWSADRIPTSARFRNDFLERLDWTFRDMGLAASEIEVLRLEVTS